MSAGERNEFCGRERERERGREREREGEREGEAERTSARRERSLISCRLVSPSSVGEDGAVCVETAVSERRRKEQR